MVPRPFVISASTNIKMISTSESGPSSEPIDFVHIPVNQEDRPLSRGNLQMMIAPLVLPITNHTASLETMVLGRVAEEHSDQEQT